MTLRASRAVVLPWLVSICALLCSGVVAAQQPPPAAPTVGESAGPAVPTQREDEQPRVDTSAAAPAPAAAPAAAPAGRSAAAGRTPSAPPSGRRAMDRVELEASQITGNRELPRVLYIVPWKRSDLGDLAGRPVNSLLDEVLAPVDRDVFRRETRYFDALGTGSRPVPAAPAPAESPSGDTLRNTSQPPPTGGN